MGVILWVILECWRCIGNQLKRPWPQSFEAWLWVSDDWYVVRMSRVRVWKSCGQQQVNISGWMDVAIDSAWFVLQRRRGWLNEILDGKGWLLVIEAFVVSVELCCIIGCALVFVSWSWWDEDEELSQQPCGRDIHCMALRRAAIW